MRRYGIFKRAAAVFAAFAVFAGNISFAREVSAASGRQVEALTRGLTVTALSKGTLVSWRSLGTDPENTTFELYRGSTLIYTSTQGMPTCYSDTAGSISADYSVKVYKNGAQTASETAGTEYRLNYDSTAKGGYFDIRLDTPTDSRLGATYTANDASVADLDGDGQYELIIKWDPSNSQDNSKDGATSNVIIDAYEIAPGNAARLWRIDLGQNIRAGAHYTQFMVYDLDGDGIAEMVCKTAPGSKDGAGNYVNTASSISAIKNANDNGKAYANSAGRILSGSEYLTLFDGQTGKALDTIYYEPERGDISKWGSNESYGNRVDRFLGGIAYLNGKTPSVLMCRGYYGRSVIAAYDVVDKKLAKRWIFDTNDSGNSDYAGQGNHSLTTADVDGDGYDEVVYGAMTVDHNGKGLYTTKLGHGDAMHVGDLMPDRDGLEIYQVYEETYGASLKDAKTGKILQRWNATSDTGRGVGDNLIAGNRSAEFCSSADSVVYDCDGNKAADWSEITKWGQNSLIYWDGDLEREVMDRAMIDKYKVGRLFTGQGVEYNNASKSNMCITADIFGDWREEIVARLSDGSGVRVYATPYPTDYRIFTLMHDTQYRCGVAAENVGYNQPPHVSFWLGTGDPLPDKPAVYSGESSEAVIPFNNGYDFSLDAGTLTADSTKGGAYYSVTGSKAGGTTRVTLDGSNFAYLDDSDPSATVNLILPISDIGNQITVKGSFKLPSANGNWTFLQIHGKNGSGANTEISGIRTDNNTYKLRTAAASALVDTGLAVQQGNEISYEIVIDKVLQKAYLTMGGKTVSENIDCASVSEIRFITAKAERYLYAGSVDVSYKLFGDTDLNNKLDPADAALILKYVLNKNTALNTELADYDRSGVIELADAVKILEDL